MKLLISKFSSVLPLTAICSIQKITNANSNREINGGSEDLIDSGITVAPKPMIRE